jgi:hypothetical protein
LCLAQGERQRAEPLLGTIVQVPLQPPALAQAEHALRIDDQPHQCHQLARQARRKAGYVREEFKVVTR